MSVINPCIHQLLIAVSPDDLAPFMVLGKGLSSFLLQQVQGMRLKSTLSALAVVASSNRDSNGCYWKSPSVPCTQ